MSKQIQETISNINTKSLMLSKGLRFELEERKVFSATLKDKDNKIIERLDIPCSTDTEIKMLLMGYQLALAQK